MRHYIDQQIMIILSAIRSDENLRILQSNMAEDSFGPQGHVCYTSSTVLFD